MGVNSWQDVEPTNYLQQDVLHDHEDVLDVVDDLPKIAKSCDDLLDDVDLPVES